MLRDAVADTGKIGLEMIRERMAGTVSPRQAPYGLTNGGCSPPEAPLLASPQSPMSPLSPVVTPRNIFGMSPGGQPSPAVQPSPDVQLLHHPQPSQAVPPAVQFACAHSPPVPEQAPAGGVAQQTHGFLSQLTEAIASVKSLASERSRSPPRRSTGATPKAAAASRKQNDLPIAEEDVEWEEDEEELTAEEQNRFLALVKQGGWSTKVADPDGPKPISKYLEGLSKAGVSKLKNIHVWAFAEMPVNERPKQKMKLLRAVFDKWVSEGKP